MRVFKKGHIYELDHRGAYPGIDPKLKTALAFVNREEGNESEGTTTQEVIRALIDRTWYCNDCLPWEGNLKIIGHLRMALALHEVRAIIRKVEKGELEPEFLQLGSDGHALLPRDPNARPSEYARMPDTGTDTGGLNPGVCAHHVRMQKIERAIEDEKREANMARARQGGEKHPGFLRTEVKDEKEKA